MGKIKDFSLEEDKRSINSLDLSKLKSNRSHKNSNGSKDSTLEKNKKDKNIERLKTKRHNSLKSNGMIIKTNMNESPKLNKIKSPKKRREIGVNHKLDIISKNITGASKNINNPEQFYMDFFNDLINKKACLINKSEQLNNKDINEQEKHKNKKKV
jgi:DNA polymerase II small subunit/DNA polymerase delta subunit B